MKEHQVSAAADCADHEYARAEWARDCVDRVLNLQGYEFDRARRIADTVNKLVGV